ncbi:MAG: hypothetical protein K8T89_00195 [Planctomycetes bacterium]|nr:hypothetical protein [Planctomycetota bacterium]
MYSCEIDVEPIDGAILPGEVIRIIDRGSPFECVVLAVLPQKHATAVTLVCLNWIVPDNDMVGKTFESKPMKSAERKRYLRFIAEQKAAADGGRDSAS